MDWYGYNGKILTIDLEKDHFSESVIKNHYIEDYIGGFGLNCRLFTERFVPGIDPLSELNPIILGAGPLVGTGVPGASRTVAITKFPATGAIANSCGSMSFGFHLKQSGFDHIIIENKAESPIVLVISDDYYELLDANDLWGLDIVKANNILYSEFPDSSVICIGQAGEKLIPQAISLIDRTSTLGRGGLGAVMGAKNLKAILVKGSMGIKVADPGNFQKIYSKFMRRVKNYPYRDSWIELGMLRSLPIGMILQAKGEKEKAQQCNERTYLKKLKGRRIACPSCPMADKDILKIDNGRLGESLCYTSSVINPFLMFTSDFLKTSNDAIRIFDLINRYGLDAFTITSMLEFLLRNYENGNLSDEDIGLNLIKEYEIFQKIIEMIIEKEGIGKYLADGWEGLSRKFPELENDMECVKGLDIIFEPRFLRLGTMEFEQIVNPKGSHVASGGSPTYVGASYSIDKFKSHFNRMGIPDSAFERLFTPVVKQMKISVGRLTRYSEDWYTILSSLGLCARAQMNRFYSLDWVVEMYNIVTGWTMSKEKMSLAAERSWNLMKLMNVSEGFSRKDDSFPDNWFKPLKFGKNNNELMLKSFFGNVLITPEIAQLMLDSYYDERGWNKHDGTPSAEKLKELNLHYPFKNQNIA